MMLNAVSDVASLALRLHVSILLEETLYYMNA